MNDSMNKKRAKEVLSKEENQLALKQAAALGIQEDHETANAETLNEAIQNSNAMYNSLDWDRFAEENYKDLDNALNNFKQISSDMSFAMAEAANAESATMSNRVKVFNEQMKAVAAQYGEDSQEYQAIIQQYSMENWLKDSEDTLRKLESNNVGMNQITALMNSIHSLKGSASSAAKILDTLANSTEGFSKASTDLVLDMIKNTNRTKDSAKYWSELTGKTTKELMNMDDDEFRQLTQAYIDKFANFAANGINASNIGDFRDKTVNRQNSLNEIRDNIMGEGLTTENKDYLAENYGELYASKTFQDALKNNSAIALQMLEEANNKNTQSILGDMGNARTIAEGQLTKLLQDNNLDSYEQFFNMSDEERAAALGDE